MSLGYILLLIGFIPGPVFFFIIGNIAVPADRYGISQIGGLRHYNGINQILGSGQQFSQVPHFLAAVLPGI